MNDSRRSGVSVGAYLYSLGPQWARGVCMGAADVVPGVSGGTVALVLGIYRRLVTAISHFDVQALSYVRRGQWSAAAKHVDLVFLLALGSGIVTGLIAALLTLHHLLERPETRPFLRAVFFGMVAASTYLVGYSVYRSAGDAQQFRWWAFFVGTAAAATISLGNPAASAAGPPPLIFVFLGGMIAICAMILPGISGALMLVLLGLYEYIVGAARGLLHLEHLSENGPAALVFAAGCATGLMTFTRLLRRLLHRRPGVTLSLLCGLMAGSLVALWPFQSDLTPEIDEIRHKAFRPAWPELQDTTTWAIFATAFAAALVTVVIEWWARRNRDTSEDRHWG